MSARLRFQPVYVLGIVAIASTSSFAADFSGTYESPQLSVQINPQANGYDGAIQMGDQKFPLTAHEDHDHLVGTFISADGSFPFTAEQQGQDLVLSSGGHTYSLHRHQAPLNAPATAPVDALADYTVMTESSAGRSLVHEVPGVKTTFGALRSTFPDLVRFFGGKPTILGSYEDHRDHKSAFVSFTATLAGVPYKGFVTTRLRDQGAVVFVVYSKASATHAEWTALTADPADKGERDIKQLMAEVPLKPYAFPDGTGAIGLAEGYTTHAQTESNLIINGPAGQRIRMAYGGTVLTPNNPMANNPNANAAVAPYSDDPATALGNVIRATSVLSARRGGPTYTPERVIKVTPIPPRNPGSRAAQITYDVAGNEPGGVRHFRVFIQFEYHRTGNASWGYYTYLQLIAPQETFKQDYPVMMAQAFSASENVAAVMEKSRREMAAAKALADAQHEAAEKLAKARYEQTRSVEAASAARSRQWRSDEENEAIKSRSGADFSEVIRGIRTVEDTRTGEQTSVDLADVHDIVDKLNYQDPDRYREIPLRDEIYPLPGHEHDPDYLPRY